jgi:hypothetical protein
MKITKPGEFVYCEVTIRPRGAGFTDVIGLHAPANGGPVYGHSQCGGQIAEMHYDASEPFDEFLARQFADGEPPATMFRVMRKAQLMEDEGRDQFEADFATKEAADAWIAAQSGYFRPGDYFIIAP